MSTNGNARRARTSRADWDGGQADVGLNLRRRGTTLADPPSPDDRAFGIYLGRVRGKYAVGVKDFWSWRVVEMILYDSVEAMKAVWELD